MNELHAQMKAKLEQTGLGFESIKVFGAIRCNVHVICSSRDTAQKWSQLLATVFKGEKVALVPTTWNAAKNNGTCLAPTMRKGFLIAVAG